MSQEQTTYISREQMPPEQQNLWLFLGSLVVLIGFFVPCMSVNFVTVVAGYTLEANGLDTALYSGPLGLLLCIVPGSTLFLLTSSVIKQHWLQNLRWRRIIHLTACMVLIGGLGYFLLDYFFLGGHAVVTVLRQATATRCNPSLDLPCYSDTYPARFSIEKGPLVIALGLIVCISGLYHVEPSWGSRNSTEHRISH